MTSTQIQPASKEAGAPRETEIEITPAMIEAGVDAYLAVDRRVADIEFVVLKIFDAMWASHRRPNTDFRTPPNL